MSRKNRNPYLGLSKLQLLNMEIDRTEKILERLGESPRMIKYLKDLNESKMLLHDNQVAYSPSKELVPTGQN